MTGGRGADSRTRTDFAAVAQVREAFLAPWGPVVQAQGLSAGDGPDGAPRLDDWRDAQGRLALRLVTVPGGGHEWPGGRRAKDGDGTGFSATAELLRFLELYP